MKRNILILIALALFASCSKPTYPSDPYRGSGPNRYYYQNNRPKSKDNRQYRSNRHNIRKEKIKPLK